MSWSSLSLSNLVNDHETPGSPVWRTGVRVPYFSTQFRAPQSVATVSGKYLESAKPSGYLLFSPFFGILNP
jgi:hypothetical protein